MNFLILILNRAYFFLLKVKNQSPLLGATILVTLLFSVSIHNLMLLIFAFSNEALKIDNRIEFAGMILIFFILFEYAKKRKSRIIQVNIKRRALKNTVVTLIFLCTTILFILLSNINREKIFMDTKKENNPAKRESLEGRIRNWLK